MEYSDSADLNKLVHLFGRSMEELGVSLDLDETVCHVCDIPLSILADWSTVHLVNWEGRSFTYMASSHRIPSLRGVVREFFRSSDCSELKPLRVFEAVQSGEATISEHLFPWNSPSAVTKVLCLPLRRRSEIIGVICLGIEATRSFPAEDITLALDYAHRAAGAIDNAILFRRALEAERQLRAAKSAAEEANRAKSQFLANMSHEIRTPLGAILGFVDCLLEPNQNDEERIEWAQRVRDNGQHLLRLINDILNLSRVEAGKIEIESQRIQLSSLVQMIESALGSTARKKSILLQFELETPVASQFSSDVTRLQQILLNVVGNAVKFTDHGWVKVAIGQKARFIYFRVEDTGPGLTAAQTARLFQPFMQADASSSHKYGGTGLGLALSKKLAQLLGGDLELLSSEPGKGSKFQLSIRPEFHDNESYLTDFDLKSLNKAPASIETKESIRLDGARVLVVDDSGDNRLLISRVLKFHGADVMIAESGDAALSLVQGHSFDVVLMDIQMPGKDGYATTRELRSSGFDKPIIALTANALLSQRELSFQSGCTEYLTKPIDRQALVKAIAVCVN